MRLQQRPSNSKAIAQFSRQSVQFTERPNFFNSIFMETHEQHRQRLQDEITLQQRLQLATTRLEEAQQERIWAIVAAKEAGLSIRKIAAATQLSPTRVHQLLQDPEVDEITTWLSQLRHMDHPELKPEDDPVAIVAHRLEFGVEVLRWCLEWLSKLERGEQVIVNLLPEPLRMCESFDLARVIRILSRVTADLDELQCNAQTNNILPSEPKDKAVAKSHQLRHPNHP